MKKYFLFYSTLCCFVLLHSQNPTFQWARQIGDVDYDYGNSITSDANGNVYAAGDFNGTVDFDPGPGTYTMTSLGHEDGYFTKFDVAGNFVWAIQVGDTGVDEGVSVKVDAAGNVFLLGYFEGMVDLDPGPGTSSVLAGGYYDSYIIKLNSSGNFVWGKHINTTVESYEFSIAFDGSGNIFTTGTFQGTTDFDPGPGTYTLTAAGFYDIFISKYDASGNFIWTKQIGNTGFDVAYSLALDGSGNIYSTGYYSNAVDFDPGAGISNLISNGGFDAYILKLDANGNLIWAKSMGGTGNERSFSIALDQAANPYITGFFENTGDFDPGAGISNLTSAGGWDIFVAKLNANGNFSWAGGIGGPGNDYGSSIALDGSANVYVAGTFTGTCDFDIGAGTFTLPCAGQSDAFVLKLNSSGNFIWAGQIGGTNANDNGNGIAIDPSFNVLVTGAYDDVSDLDPGAGTSTLICAGPGTSDAFILKLSQCATPPTPANTTNTLNLSVCAGSSTTLTASGSGTLSWYSSPTSTLSLGTGTAFITPTLSAGNYTFYVEAALCNVSASRAAVSISVSPCTGIFSNNNVALFAYVYPNPSNGEFTLNSSVDGIIYIYDALGKLIVSDQLIIGSKKIDLTPFPRGIYFLKIGSDKDIKIIKLMKE